jgi:hypothetical protein
MNDFLTNLAARSSPSAEVLKPRLPSIFEPKRSPLLSGLAGMTATQQADGEVSEERFSDNVRTKPVSSDQAQPSTSSTRLRTEQAGASRGPMVEPPKERNRPVLPPVTSLPSPHGFAVAAPVTPTPTPAMAPNIRLAAPTANGQTEARAMQIVSERRNAEDEVRPPQKVSLPKSESEPPSPKSANVSDPSSEYIARLVRSLRPPRVEPRLDAGSSRAARSAAHSDPTIQVTIGRIEVRATPEPSVKKERSPSSVMSLDEYLDQRRAGS